MRSQELEPTLKGGYLRHPEREDFDKTIPKRLENVFGKIRVIHTTVFVSMQSCYPMCSYVSHLPITSNLSKIKPKHGSFFVKTTTFQILRNAKVTQQQNEHDPSQKDQIFENEIASKFNQHT